MAARGRRSAGSRPFHYCFGDAELIEGLLGKLHRGTFPAGRLVLEITESVLDQPEEQIAACLGKLKRAGARIALDDFGTGYSSLSRLKRFPIDILKIDQSFVRDVLTDQEAARLVNAIIRMGSSLNLKIVAEGVETDPQLAFLRKGGCNAVQGYLIARPLPLAELCDLFNHRVDFRRA